MVKTSNNPNSATTTTTTTKRLKKSGRFLKSLKRITLESPPEVAHWSRDGKQFDVIDPKRFDEMLLVYFPNANPRTFFRQLSHYRITKLNCLNGGGDDATPGTFSLRHALFLRDEPDKMFEIQCRNRKRYTPREEIVSNSGEEDQGPSFVNPRPPYFQAKLVGNGTS